MVCKWRLQSIYQAGEKTRSYRICNDDADAPGAIVRFWLTTVVKSGKIRFYFDSEEKPSIEVPAFDLMKAGFNLGPGLLNPHSSYEPHGKGGNTLYLPLPYQKHCKITWEYTDTATMQMLSWTGGTIDASATTYWYGFKGSKDNF